MLSCVVKKVAHLIFATLAAVANGLPKQASDALVSVCAAFAFVFSSSKRRSLADNLSHAGKKPQLKSLYGVFRTHSRNVVDMIASSRWKPDSLSHRFDFEGGEALDSALAQGKGVVLVTQHIGGWEAAAVYLSSLGYKLSVVAGIQLSPLLTDDVKRTKEKLGIEVINPQDPPRKLIKALLSGRILALLVDGNVFNGGVELEFLGESAVLPDGPVRLARVTSSPILAGFCRRLDSGNFKIYMEKVIEAADIERIGERKALEIVYRVVERFIRENADQWVMFRRLWKNER